MAKSSEYWKERFTKLEEEGYRESKAYYEDLQKQFRIASNNISMIISSWYYRIADNNEISYSVAKRFLNRKDVQEFKWTLEDYIQYGRENAINQKWIKELENASARVHISWMEAVKLQMQQEVEKLFVQYEGGVSDFLGKQFESQFYRTAYEIEKGTGVGINIPAVDKESVQTILSKPWAQDGKDFSSRIWSNKQKLVDTLHNELTQQVVTGADPQKAIDAIAKKMEVTKNQAGNLVMTESAAIQANARQEAYKALGVEEFEFIATLDFKTSEICRKMDKKRFLISDYKVGVTVPPMHCRCRSCTAPYIDEEFSESGMRATRDPITGEENFVPANMTYQEWYDKYVAGNPDAVLKEKKHKNRFSDEEQFKRYQGILGKEAPKTLDDFQNIKYNGDKWKVMKREYKTIDSINGKSWSNDFKAKAKDTYYEFRKHGIEMTDHGLARYLDRSKQSFTFSDIVEQHGKSINYTQPDGRQVRFYDRRALITSSDTGEVVSIVPRNNISKEWSVFNE